MSKMMYMDTQYAGVTPEKDYSELIDFFYPIGCYFETSDSSFDPNTDWGGYWVLEAEGQVHVSAGTNYPVSGALTNTNDSGTTAHDHSTGDFTLQTTHIPSHNHGYTNPSTICSKRYGYQAKSGYTSGSALDYVYLNDSGGSRMPTTGGSVGYSGGGQAHNHGNTGSASNMQPYINVYRWHRMTPI